MLMLARIVLAMFGFMTGWFFSYWASFVQFDLADRPILGRGVPFLIGLAVAGLILALTRRLQHGFLSSAVLGAVMLGSIGFVIGFFGIALIGLALGYDPNVAPLWGFVLGPLGFVLGGPMGALWWWLRERRAVA